MNTTFASNTGGGVYNAFITVGYQCDLVLNNSIFAGNLGGLDVSILSVPGGTATGASNLVQTSSGLPAGVVSLTSDPRLGPLQDNGGPSFTHALLTGSPAIDAGDDSTCTVTDQRGLPRPLDGNLDGVVHCDLGAYEAGSVQPPVAATGPASPISGTGATLNGKVNPGGLPTTAWFEWDPTMGYGNFTPHVSVGSGHVPVSIAHSLNGLTAGFTYYHRAVASNSLGLAHGPVASFQATNAMVLGAIPDQAVWHGCTNGFLLQWTNTTPVSFALETFPTPRGILSLVPFSETLFLFQYAPALTDKTNFTVTITASSGGQTLSQSFLISPQPVLLPEQTVFGTDRHTQPAALTRYGIKTFDRASIAPESLNYQTGIVRSVRIVGETVEIRGEETNRLYQAYFNADRRDIKEMEIIAETLIITPVVFRDGPWFP